MPYKNDDAQKEYLRNYRATHRSAELKAARDTMGHHTRQSIHWPKPMLTESQAAWIAACIDCEGCLSLGSYWNKRRGSYNFHVNASLQMTVPAVVHRLKDLCGGRIFKNDRDCIKHKSVWAWHLSANGVRWLLPQIIDSLMVKRRQAELLIEFLTISKKGVSTRAEYNPRAQAIRSEMTKLNQRGIITAPIGASSEPSL